MIIKRDVKEMMREKYLDKTDKIIDIDIWNLEGTEFNVWVLVKTECGVLYFYNIRNYGKEYQEVYKGIVLMSDVKTRRLNY